MQIRTSLETIKIHSSLYDYEVEFIDSVEEKLKQFGTGITYVIDKNVYGLYPQLFESISTANIFFVNAVEKEKNMDTVLELIYFWKKIGVKKNWKVVCFGGGITQDITTFASNIYLRNVDWYFFPTTLLAMSDSCIGGKCGINLENYKNQLGVFYPPKKIFIYDKFLETLSNADYINGWGELLKFALTEKEEFFDELSTESQYIPCERINEYIYQGLEVKKNVIEADEFEGDLRRILNYGHTFGHALESYTDNQIPHGTAVIWGIDVVNYIAFRTGILEEAIYCKVKDLIKSAFIREEIVVEDAKKLYEIIKTDKKVKDNTIYLALLDRLSHLSIVPMKIDDQLEKMFRDYLEETHVYYCN